MKRLGLLLAGLLFSCAAAWAQPPDGCDDSPLWVLGGSKYGQEFALAWASWSKWEAGAGWEFEVQGDSATYVLSLRMRGPDTIESLTRQAGRAEIAERYVLRRQHGGCLYVGELQPGVFLIFGMADPVYESEIMARVQRAKTVLNPSKWY